MKEILPENLQDASIELAAYFYNSLGILKVLICVVIHRLIQNSFLTQRRLTTSVILIFLGNKVRIDYGTGHETAFMAWIYCFHVLGLLSPTDYPAIVFKVIFSPLFFLVIFHLIAIFYIFSLAKVFYNYILLTRKFLKRYGLEPAGSQGVWSLDDHHFLIFYFGSSQLRGTLGCTYLMHNNMIFEVH